MKRLTWYGYTVEVDGEATRDWYAGAEEWGCDCVLPVFYCRQ